MQATAAASSFETNFRPSPAKWQQEDPANEWRVIEPVIELAITQANAQGAYVYRFDHDNGRASLCAFVGPAPFTGAASRLQDVGGAAVAFHRDRRTPIVLHQGISADWRFAPLPEFKSGLFDGAVSVPLIAPTGVVGMANFCRIESSPFRARELAFLIGLNASLAALLATSTLHDELQRKAQQLADRKILDRAKGVLQESFGWTEEEAYLQIRRLSRQHRTPMREIARHVIQSAGREVVA